MLLRIFVPYRINKDQKAAGEFRNDEKADIWYSAFLILNGVFLNITCPALPTARMPSAVDSIVSLSLAILESLNIASVIERYLKICLAADNPIIAYALYEVCF
jgi:hypothetical protein